MKKIIENIKVVEIQAEEKVGQVHEVCQKIMQDARKEAAKIIDREVKAAEKEVAQLRLMNEKELGKIVSSKKNEAEKKKVEIIKKSHERLEEAVRYVMAKIIGEL